MFLKAYNCISIFKRISCPETDFSYTPDRETDKIMDELVDDISMRNTKNPTQCWARVERRAVGSFIGLPGAMLPAG